MDIQAALAATPTPPATPNRRPEHPKGFEYEWDGDQGHILTGPLPDKPRTWDALLVDAGLDPDEVEVLEPVQVRGWDGLARMDDGTTGVVRQHYYRLTVRRRALRVDLDELVKAAKSGRRKNQAPSGETAGQTAKSAFLIALGDLQLGKMDGDGVEGTVTRFLDATSEAVARYKRLRRTTPGMPIYLAHLGDCIEGHVSQGGANSWRTTLTTTEQVRLYRRLLIEQIKALAPLTPKLVVCGVPGNHDEAHRPLHTYGDSWAIDSVAAVRDALDLAGTYQHVTLHAPARDELTLTLDVCGTVVGMAHGHQWRAGKAPEWWAKQSHGRQPIGDADLLLSAHLHHLRIEATGSDKTWVQVPALESGSQWWKHRTGEWGQPGIVTAVVGGGGWHALEVL